MCFILLFQNIHISIFATINWAEARQNQQNDLRAQWRLRSVWASAQSDQSSLGAQLVAKDPSFLHADSEDWSDWADDQADLSFRWVHRSFCWFCPAVGCIDALHLSILL